MNDRIFKEFPNIITPKLVLRGIQFKDVQQFYKIRSDERVMKYMGRDVMQTIAEAKNMINTAMQAYKEKKGISWAITLKSSDLLIGYAGFWRLIKEHFRAEIAFALLPGYWGKGIMVEALAGTIKFGFEKMNLHSIEANVDPGNIPAIKLLEKLNFKKEAHFKENFFFKGKFYDSVIYSILQSRFPAEFRKKT